MGGGIAAMGGDGGYYDLGFSQNIGELKMSEISSYFNRVNPDILALLPPDLDSVLELGCGAGALFEAYRPRNPAVRWHGYEVNPDAAKVARDRGVSVTVADLDAAPMGWYVDGVPEVDALVCGDVLEHLRDPWRVLAQRAMWVRPGGQVLACVPNVGHWTILRGLLDGEWDYQDEGLLDRTHLRFFTLKSIRAMFKGAGLDVFEIRGRPICNDGHGAFWGEWLGGSGRDGRLWDESRAYQYVVRAVRARHASLRIAGRWSGDAWKPEPLHVHAVLDRSPVNGTCCEAVRIHEPFAAMATIPGVRCTDDAAVRGAPNPDRHGAVPADSDAVLVFQRPQRTGDQLAGIVGRMLAEKPRAVAVCEIDDHPEHILKDPAVLGLFHAVQCSTEPLAEVCRRYNPEVAVFPNQLAEIPPLREKAKVDAPVLFYGALNREADWAPIMPALCRVLADHPDVSVSVVHDRAFHEALPARTPKQFRPFAPYPEYRRALRACDIAILPLEDTPFNRCKSDVKFLECAADGVAVLASRTAFDQIHGADTIIFKQGALAEYWSDVLPFEVQLGDLIRNADRRRYLVENAHAYVRDHRLLGGHFRARYDWYRSLLGRKAELDAGLAERIEGLQAVEV